MKNLLKLGKALSKVEQKQIFGGDNTISRWTEPCNENIDPNCGGAAGGGGPGGGNSCVTDAECGMAAVQVEVPLEDCPPAAVELFGGCGYTTEYVQMTCLVGAGGSGVCVA